jgi:predicted nucleotidyltransferase
MFNELAQILSGFQPRVLFAYVFGSSGTAMENSLSDLDVALYLDAEAGSIELNHKLAIYAEVSRAIKRNDIDVVILNTCSNQLLVYDIMINGRLIYDADPGARAVFEQQMLHAAIDFKESRDRILYDTRAD